MTQSSSAQPVRHELAWHPARKGRTLAAQRAALEARMRSMAVTDLKDVSARLKDLHKEYERRHGKLKQEDLARRLKTPTRTFQSWVNGEVETDRVNYEKFARFYSRGLGRKITANWILFGQDKPAKPSVNSGGAAAEPERETSLSKEDSDRIERIEREQQEQRELLEEIIERLPPAEPAEDDEDLKRARDAAERLRRKEQQPHEDAAQPPTPRRARKR